MASRKADTVRKGTGKAIATTRNTTATREIEAHPERDIYFYEGETAKILIGNGRLAILFPQDAHAPCIAAGESRPVRKVVVKVAVE